MKKRDPSTSQLRMCRKSMGMANPWLMVTLVHCPMHDSGSKREADACARDHTARSLYNSLLSGYLTCSPGNYISFFLRVALRDLVTSSSSPGFHCCHIWGLSFHMRSGGDKTHLNSSGYPGNSLQDTLCVCDSG